MSDKVETRTVCSACGHVNGSHLFDCKISELESQLAAAKAEIERLEADRTRLSIASHEVVFENKRLRDTLETIANYDKYSKYGSGICDYGCDTPSITKAALSPDAGPQMLITGKFVDIRADDKSGSPEVPPVCFCNSREGHSPSMMCYGAEPLPLPDNEDYFGNKILEG